MQVCLFKKKPSLGISQTAAPHLMKVRARFYSESRSAILSHFALSQDAIKAEILEGFILLPNVRFICTLSYIFIKVKQNINSRLSTERNFPIIHFTLNCVFS